MTETKPAPLAVIENIHAPEVWASIATGFSNDGGAIKITFSSYRTTFPPNGPQAAMVEVGRLVMPLHGAIGLATGLYDYLKNHDLLPKEQAN
jgi:hypothetical protein